MTNAPLPGGDATPLDLAINVIEARLNDYRDRLYVTEAALTLARQQVTEMETQHEEMFGTLQRALGLDRVGDDPDDLWFHLKRLITMWEEAERRVTELKAQVTALQQERGELRWEQRKSDAWIREMTEERNTFRARAEAAEQQVAALREAKVKS